MQALDETYMAYPFFGSRQMTRWLRRQGYPVNCKRVQRLMLLMEFGGDLPEAKPLEPSSRAPHASYLLREVKENRANQVFATDVTYVLIQGGFINLCAVIDWYSLTGLGAVEHARRHLLCKCNAAGDCHVRRPRGRKQILGLEIKVGGVHGPLLKLGVKIGMDCRSRCLDNVFVERLWRTVKFDEIYLKSYRSQIEAYANLDTFCRFYNEKRPHGAFGNASPITPMEVYRGAEPIAVNQ